MIVHPLKVYGWPECQAFEPWRDEIANVQQDAEQRYVRSMRQRIDLNGAFARARRQLEDTTFDGRASLPLPAICPFTLDQLLNERRPALEAILAAASSSDHP